MTDKNVEFPTHEKIERRAYQFYLEHGFHPGNALADWIAAENELIESSQSEGADKSPANLVSGLRKHATA